MRKEEWYMMDVQKFYFSFQDGIKRFETAMYGLPDRVPVYAQTPQHLWKM
jgi:hypothetical protein